MVKEKGTVEKGIEKTGEAIDKGVDTGVKATKGFFKRLKEGWKTDKEPTGKFEIYKDKRGEYRFRLKAGVEPLFTGKIVNLDYYYLFIV